MRLGLTPLWNELESILTGFDLRIEEKKNANGGAAVREKIDEALKQAAGWTNAVSGDIDWIKCETINGARVCLGVEIQFSGRSDLMIVDVDHLRDHIADGSIDVGSWHGTPAVPLFP